MVLKKTNVEKSSITNIKAGRQKSTDFLKVKSEKEILFQKWIIFF